MKIAFRFVTGARAGETVELSLASVLRLGRRPDSDVACDAQRDLGVSGLHAEVYAEPHGVFIRDAGSANGTLVGGEPIRAPRILRDGDEIRLGHDGPRIAIQLIAPAVVPSAPPVVAAPASAGQTAAAGLAAGDKVGANTVAMMIDQALLRSRASQSAGKVQRSTVFLRSMVNDAVKTSTRRFKVTIALLALALIGAVGGFIALRHYEDGQATDRQAALAARVASLMTEQGTAAGADKTKLAARIDALNRKLVDSTPASAGRRIVQASRNAVYLMAAMNPRTRRAKGFCTAFAVQPRLLATNAHCVVAMQRHLASGLRCFVVMNQQPKRRFTIAQAVPHPDYRSGSKTITRDVGVLQLTADLPVTLAMASTDALGRLESGDVMFTYGFPGRLARVTSPAATLVQGVIGRVTTLSGSHGTAASSLLIQHSAFTSGGTSGSPIFDGQARVIAVNAGSYVEPGTMQVMNPLTGRASTVKVRKQLAGYNFGIRIDALARLIERLGW